MRIFAEEALPDPDALDLGAVMFHTKEPQRSKLMELFHTSDEPLRIKAVHADGSPSQMVVVIRGKRHSIGPKGKNVGRHDAVEMLWQYGEGGVYRDKHQPTGMTEQLLDTLPVEQQEYWLTKKGVTFRNDYLVHVVRDDVPEE